MEFVNYSSTTGMNFVGDSGKDYHENIFLERMCPHLFLLVINALNQFNAFHEYCEINKIKPTFENYRKYVKD